MNKKTAIRFSKALLKEMPSIALDTFGAAEGEVCAWIHTGERVIEALGSTVSMCIYHHSIKQLSKEAEEQMERNQQLFRESELQAMETYREQLKSMKEQLQNERAAVEKRIEEEKAELHRIRSNDQYQTEIRQQIQNATNEKLRMIQEQAAEERSLAESRGNVARKQIELQIAQQRLLSETVRTVRMQLKEVIDLYDQKLKDNPMLKELPQDARLRMDEQYRILLWQYRKNIEF